MKTFPPKEAGSGSPGYPGHRRLQLHVRLSKPYGSQVPAEILASSEPRRIIPGERPIGLICSHLGPTTDVHSGISPNPDSLLPSRVSKPSFGLLAGPCLESCWPSFSWCKEPMFRPKDLCFEGAIICDPSLYIAQMTARAITRIWTPLDISLPARPL